MPTSSAALKLNAFDSPRGNPMNLAVLKWVANGMIAVVVVGTLWMAHVLTGHSAPQAVPITQTLSLARAASAPGVTLR